VSARTLADAYLQRWGVPPEQIGRPAPQVPAQPAEPVMRNQAPVSPVAAPRNGNRPPRSRSVKARGMGSNGTVAAGGVAAAPVQPAPTMPELPAAPEQPEPEAAHT
jgi:hypothetical protein